MSRIGRMPIEIPAGVTVTYDNHHMNVKGPKGELSRDLHPDMIITVEGNGWNKFLAKWILPKIKLIVPFTV